MLQSAMATGTIMKVDISVLFHGKENAKIVFIFNHNLLSHSILSGAYFGSS